MGYLRTTHRNGHSSQSFSPGARKGLNTKKGKYRLLADGTIYDQEINQSVGFVPTTPEIEEGWKLRGKPLQAFLMKFL